MPNIKIMIVYHKPSVFFNGEDFLPINAGRALIDENIDENEKIALVKNTVGDDTGDNISAKNRSYNELTAAYYAWKNLDADYYGLTHYRRTFVFDETITKKYIRVKRIEDLPKKSSYSRDKLVDMLGRYDFIAPKPIKTASVYEHYEKAHDVNDLEAVRKIIENRFKEYARAADKYLFGSQEYLYNMFVFDKPTFFRYCEFVFGVLKEAESRFVGKRMFVSERLTGIFITKLLLEGKKGLFLPTIFAAEKEEFSSAIERTKKSLALRRETGKKGFGSLVYALKPLLEKLLPNFVFDIYKNR